MLDRVTILRRPPIGTLLAGGTVTCSAGVLILEGVLAGIGVHIGSLLVATIFWQP